MEENLTREELIDFERTTFFFKYLVLFFMCEALKDSRKIKRGHTLSRERERSIKDTQEWFQKDNKLLQEYCKLAMIDIDDLFFEFERIKLEKNNKNTPYLKPKLIIKNKKKLTLKKNK